MSADANIWLCQMTYDYDPGSHPPAAIHWLGQPPSGLMRQNVSTGLRFYLHPADSLEEDKQDEHRQETGTTSQRCRGQAEGVFVEQGAVEHRVKEPLKNL